MRFFTIKNTLLMATLAVLVLPMPNSRADGPSREYQLKAAFIYNFAQFVEWPDQAFSDAKAPIVITVLGDNPFDTALEQVTRGKTVRGREIVIRCARAAADVGRTHILFIAPSESAHAPQVLGGLQGQVLTIAESENFAAIGGVIRFFSEDNKLRFEINTSAVQRAGLKVSAKLLQLARIFKEG
jgi:hypothetical protein